LLTSCISTSVGRNFPSASIAGLEVGSTTREQVIQKFGPPYERIDPANLRIVHFGDDETAVILRYAYGHADMFLFDGAGRSLQTEFNHAGLLVDYLYVSNFQEDRTANPAKETNFDIFAARIQIIPGRTLQAGVISLMGANYRVLPFNKPGIAQRWYYAYSEQSRTEKTMAFGQTIPKTHSKWLAIDFDAQGTVQHVGGESDFPEDVARSVAPAPTL
jgi:outer membrane protein assembly factor BamE (lipoprotein component of BamABCDE complex)